MDTALQLRDYQVEAVEAVEDAARRGVRRPLLVLPTGTGKTVVFAEVIRRRGGRGLILAHREELLEQAGQKVQLVMPGVDVGIVKAERDEHDRDVVIASVQTLARESRIARLGLDWRTIVIDEAHHAAARSYRGILAQVGGFDLDDGPIVLGVTATPERGDGVGLDRVWEELTYRRDLLEMIRAGYLCDLRAIRVKVALDLDRLEVRAGDYDETQLATAMARASAPRHALDAYREHGPGRKALVFTASVRLAHEMAATFSEAGVPAAALDSDSGSGERSSALAAFKTGDVRVLANCGLLTEGFDEPSVDCLILARPTQSRPLYTQMLGRGTRRAPGKEDCLVIDLVGDSERHDLVTVASLFGLDAEQLDSQRVRSAADTLGEVGSGIPAVDGQLVSEDVDLFAGREFHWSCGEGIFVLPAGERGQIVVQRGADGWSVSELRAGGGIEALASALDLGYAQGLAEDTVRRSGAERLVLANAPWRSQPATPRQLQVLEQRGMNPASDLTKGDASDLLNLLAATSAMGEATHKQRHLLRSLGLHAPERLTKSDASRMIDRALRDQPRRRRTA